MRQHEIFHSPEELGKLARSGRRSQKSGLRIAAPKANVGPRFLSEFEHGKPTVEPAKVISAVHAADLDLAVVKRPITDTEHLSKTDYYSKHLATEFPYDRSNSQMNQTFLFAKYLRLVALMMHLKLSPTLILTP